MPRTAPVRALVCALVAAGSLTAGVVAAPLALADPAGLPDASHAHDKRPGLVEHHGRKLS